MSSEADRQDGWVRLAAIPAAPLLVGLWSSDRLGSIGCCWIKGEAGAVDFEDDGRAELVRLLNEARLRKSLSIRAAAKVAGVAPATAQGWLNGKHMPTPALRGNFRLLLAELDVDIPDSLWLPEPVVSLESSQRPAPYLGLRPYDVADREFFFGRTTELARLVGRVQQLGGAGMIVLAAASGAGKSSLLAAGLLARATVDGALAGWQAETMSPGDIRPSSEARLIVIDQFEDVFETDPEQAAETVARVGELAENAVVVLGLRSDAFAAASQYPELASALEHAMLLTPMTVDQLTEVIVEPARQLGVSVEPELVSALLRDVAPADPHAGRVRVLPLLSNILLTLWSARTGQRLTVADYYRTGGLASAVENMAESVHDRLSPEQQETTRVLFLQLLRVVEDVPRRSPLPLATLSASEVEVANRFIAARLLTTTTDEIRISHDALLAYWPRLRTWVDDSARELRERERLRQATAVWVANDRHPASLLPVLQLPIFADLLDDRDLIARLSPDEQDFLEESQQHFEAQLAAERATSNLLRRQRRLAITTTVIAVTAAIIAGIALGNGMRVQRAAQSRQLAYSVRADRAGDTFVQGQVAVVANSLSQTVEGRSALADALASDIPVRWTGSGSGVLAALAADNAEEESLLVKVDIGGGAVLWRGDERTEMPGHGWSVTDPGDSLFAVDLARLGGRPIAAIGGQRQMSIWDLTAEPKQLATVDVGDLTVYAVKFDTARGRLLIGDSDGQLRFIDLTDVAKPTEIGALQITGAVSDIALDPAGQIVHVSGGSGEIARWQVDTLPARPLAPLTYEVAQRKPRSQTLAVSPDGKQLVAGLATRATARWNLDDPAAPPVLNLQFDSWVNSVDFVDSDRYITADSAQRAKIFDAHTDAELRVLTGPAVFTSAVVVDDAPVAVDALGSVRVWQERSPVLQVSGRPIYQVVADENQQRWMAAADMSNDRVLLWTTDDDLVAMPDPVIPAGEDLVSSVQLSPDGSWLWSGTSDGKIIRWPLTPRVGAGEPIVQQVMSPTSGMHQLEVDPLGRFIVASEYGGKQTGVFTIGPNGELDLAALLDTLTPQLPTLNSDGTMLAIGLAEQQVQLWSLADLHHPVLAGSFEVEANPAAVRYSPADELVAVGLGSGMVSLWDVHDPARPVQVQVFDQARGEVISLAFDDKGELLTAAVTDGSVLIWTIRGHRGELLLNIDTRPSGSGAAFEARPVMGGSHLVATNGDGQIKVWPLDLDQARQQVCDISGTPLSDVEWSRYLVGVRQANYCR